MDYFFSVNVIYTSYMQTQINALGLSGTLLSIATDASTNTMTVGLTFPTALSSNDVTTLTNYMNAYTDPVVTQNAINDILTALNTDANVILIARARIVATVPSEDVLTLLQICTLLGVNPNS